MKTSRVTVCAIVCIGCLLAIASPARADAGTPLMWASLFHLVIGNALIGVLEGLVLLFVFKTKRRVIWWMILANYVSAFAGLMILGAADSAGISSKWTIYDVNGYLWMATIALFLATILLEWPFCWLGFGKRPKRVRKSFFASVLAQTVSYAILVPLYYHASGLGLAQDVHADRAFVASSAADADVYYLSSDKGAVWCVGINGQNAHEVRKLPEASPHGILFARTSPDGKNFDLWLSEELPSHDRKDTLVLPAFARSAGKSEWEDSYRMANAAVMPEMDEPDWDVWISDWAWWGLRAENKKTRAVFHVSLETPFLQWRIRSATLLSGNRAVFQFGRQIVLLSLDSKKIGLIAIGDSPVVASESKK